MLKPAAVKQLLNYVSESVNKNISNSQQLTAKLKVKCAYSNCLSRFIEQYILIDI